jgi:rhodanese-related sulfurtransferase
MRWLSQAIFAGVISGFLCFVLVPAANAQDENVAEVLGEMLAKAKEGVESVSLEELDSLMEEGREVTILDVRTEAEYDAGHLRGALWAPRGKLEFWAAKGKIGAAADEIVIYCRKDSRSSMSSYTLKKLGFKNVRYLEGGFMPWVTSGRSIYNWHGELIVKEFEKDEEEQNL